MSATLTLNSNLSPSNILQTPPKPYKPLNSFSPAFNFSTSCQTRNFPEYNESGT